MKFFADLMKDLQDAATNRPYQHIHCEFGSTTFDGSPANAIFWANRSCQPEKYIFRIIPNAFANRTVYVWFDGETDGRQYEVSLK